MFLYTDIHFGGIYIFLTKKKLLHRKFKGIIGERGKSNDRDATHLNISDFSIADCGRATRHKYLESCLF